MTQKLPKDPTLDEIRAHLAPMLPDQAAFDGWNEHAIEAAAQEAGVEAAIAKLAFSSHVDANEMRSNIAMDMIEAWLSHVDEEMENAYPPEKLATMKIRDRITQQIESRLAVSAPHREALRRALSVMARPSNLRTTAKLGWRTADIMWRNAGDTATDYNHYTKRTILSGVYSSTLLVFIDDQSEDYADTRAFLARRIENVMQFEKAKAKWTGKNDGVDKRFSISRFIGRLRYPAS